MRILHFHGRSLVPHASCAPTYSPLHAELAPRDGFIPLCHPFSGFAPMNSATLVKWQSQAQHTQYNVKPTVPCAGPARAAACHITVWGDLCRCVKQVIPVACHCTSLTSQSANNCIPSGPIQTTNSSALFKGLHMEASPRASPEGRRASPVSSLHGTALVSHGIQNSVNQQ